MKRILIDKQEILDFPREEYSGFFNFVNDLIQKNNLGMQEDDAYQLCEDVLEGIMNVIESAEVIEEKEETTLHISECHEDWGDYSRPYYLYTCESCLESIRQDYPDEDFKFCPYCGAQYIVKFVEGSDGKSKYLS